MSGASTEGSALVWLFAIVVSSCASASKPEPRDVADANDTGRTVGASNGLEREVLSAMPTLSEGKPKQLAGANVVAQSAYSAASGRLCRRVVMTTASAVKQRLACTNGDGWFFVPDVFAESERRE